MFENIILFVRQAILGYELNETSVEEIFPDFAQDTKNNSLSNSSDNLRLKKNWFLWIFRFVFSAAIVTFALLILRAVIPGFGTENFCFVEKTFAATTGILFGAFSWFLKPEEIPS